ncbi:MAG: hypothetical protein QGG36_04390 [Pirellulaceae bacterium]|nr:hypothetical protein [Pirellulaceae bacterium]MDP7015009.1 hypothetical protein [Pirellulaceae bacterium]
MRIQIKELLLAITIFAFAIVSLTRSDPLFDALFFSFTLLTILGGMVMAIGRQAAARAFWIAFAMTASLYIGFAHIEDEDEVRPRHYGPELTTQLLRIGYNWMHGGSYDSILDPPGEFFPSDSGLVEVEPPQPGSGTGLSLILGGGQRIVSSGDSISFMRVGHSSWALLLGWIAAHCAEFVYLRSRRSDR